MKRLFNHEPYKYDDDTLKQVHRGVLGAIIGDIVGSRLEFKRNKEYNFELFTDANDFTDDTVMTIAVADWLTKSETRPVSNNTLPDIMRSWGRKHLWRGYGGMFHRWLVSEYEEDQRPYNSFGNGAGMRVSACGYFATTLDEALDFARKSAEVSHNHPEGIKGAQSIASAIFLARQHLPKETIRKYIAREFVYDMDRSCDNIRPSYEFDGTCQGTCPEAIIAFLDSTDFEDAIRLAISLGGDADTLGATTGSIAAAYYGVPDKIARKALEYLPKEMVEVLKEFARVVSNNMNK
ncbi:MAG: ADP-ribosylglycohydrolase family protein [Alistipes sp.]|nr:ADP-ribosylglycohydrolase family protein [Alistipes sp.]